MKKYLSHFNAAYYWDIPYIDKIFDSKCMDELQIDKIADITVTDQKLKHRNKKYRMHVYTLPLPRGAVINCHGIFVASPELVFLELANYLDMHRLILLGMQLCSHPPGNPSKALTTQRKLTTFINKTGGHIGHRKAHCAIQYVKNGSASIMESLVYMLFSLPHSYGGFGLYGACFNYEIHIYKKVGYSGLGLSGRSVKQKQYFVDLFYMKEKIAIEYDSFTHHSSPYSQGKDLLRSAELEHKGIYVMHFSTIQLYNEEACKLFAQNLASRLGKRIQIRSQRFQRSHENLRKLLPTI